MQQEAADAATITRGCADSALGKRGGLAGWVAGAMTAPDGESGRVTLAVLSTDIRYMSKQLETYCTQNAHWQEVAEERLRRLESWHQVSIERWRKHDQEHEEERKTERTQSTITSVVTSAVMAAGAFIASQLTGRPSP